MEGKKREKNAIVLWTLEVSKHDPVVVIKLIWNPIPSSRIYGYGPQPPKLINLFFF